MSTVLDELSDLVTSDFPESSEVTISQESCLLYHICTRTHIRIQICPLLCQADRVRSRLFPSGVSPDAVHPAPFRRPRTSSPSPSTGRKMTKGHVSRSVSCIRNLTFIRPLNTVLAIRLLYRSSDSPYGRKWSIIVDRSCGDAGASDGYGGPALPGVRQRPALSNGWNAGPRNVFEWISKTRPCSG